MSVRGQAAHFDSIDRALLVHIVISSRWVGLDTLKPTPIVGVI